MEPMTAMKHSSIAEQDQKGKNVVMFCTVDGIQESGGHFCHIFLTGCDDKTHSGILLISVTNAVFKSLMECLTGAQGFTFD